MTDKVEVGERPCVPGLVPVRIVMGGQPVAVQNVFDVTLPATGLMVISRLA